MTHVVHHGDCREVMATLDAESVDAVVCDPPYGLSFMGKGWDHGVPGAEFWAEAIRAAKPGTHLLAFGGTRTFHRLACAIEDAGWEIRDCVMWVYGSGFPKSLDVSKAIDKAAGAEREVLGTIPDRWTGKSSVLNFATDRPQSEVSVTGSPVTDAARQWSGWGTALKPAWEPIIVARKPLCGTVAENVLRHGTGGINVDRCRVGPTGESRERVGEPSQSRRYAHAGGTDFAATPGTRGGNHAGRWPANVIHDGSDEVVGLFPHVKTGNIKPYEAKSKAEYRQLHCEQVTGSHVGDSGSAARFFYCAKASKADREAGLREAERNTYSDFSGTEDHGPKVNVRARNHHPTVKPTALMRYLCRLVTPPGGVVLDPFTGSGSTGKAAILEGFDFVGIEREAEYVEIARARIAAAAGERPLLEAAAR